MFFFSSTLKINIFSKLSKLYFILTGIIMNSLKSKEQLFSYVNNIYLFQTIKLLKFVPIHLFLSIKSLNSSYQYIFQKEGFKYFLFKIQS